MKIEDLEVFYYKHNFGILFFKKNLNRFLSNFNLKTIFCEDGRKSNYYTNSTIIVKIHGKYIIAFIKKDFFNNKKILDEYFLS